MLSTLFGATNQILAALTLLTETVCLYRKRMPILYSFLLMILVLMVMVSVTLIDIWKALVSEQWAIAMVGLPIFVLGA